MVRCLDDTYLCGCGSLLTQICSSPKIHKMPCDIQLVGPTAVGRFERLRYVYALRYVCVEDVGTHANEVTGIIIFFSSKMVQVCRILILEEKQPWCLGSGLLKNNWNQPG